MTKFTQSTAGARALHSLLNKAEPVSVRELTTAQADIFRQGKEMLANGISIKAVECWARLAAQKEAR